MTTVFYLPLEPYEERYTLQLRDWTIAAFNRRGVSHVTIDGEKLYQDNDIHTGLVLDAHGRSYWALSQIMKVVKLMQMGEIGGSDIIYNQDFFHPGWEALPYIIAQIPEDKRPRTYSHLLAQTIDPNDFTFSMRHWMRHFELMVDKTITSTFLASSVMVDMMRASLFEGKLEVVGLPFDKDEVISRFVRRTGNQPACWHSRPKRIIYTSRFDTEKQPWFWMDLVENAKRSEHFAGWEFAICTGSKELRSNNKEYVVRARSMEQRGLLKIYEGLNKDEYYQIVGESRVQFNCAKQDFVSNTLNESSALGTVTLAPAYLAFPEALFNEPRQLYVPWSLTDALDRLTAIIVNPPLDVVSKPSDYHSLTLDRVIDVFEANAI